MPTLSIQDRIKAIQRRLGVPPDGLLGPVTLTRIEALLDRALPPPPPPDPPATPEANLVVSTRGLDRLVAFEISSEAYYKSRLVHPVWPGGASGVTIGIGYDLGFNTAAQIEKDWRGRVSDADLASLLTVAEKKGDVAKAALPGVRHVEVPFEPAKAVFYTATLPRYARLTRQAFPGVEALPADAQAALLSLVYNRGASLTGDARREMREIRDLVPQKNLAGIASKFRAMKRLWDPAKLPGLHKRRDDEAALVAGADRPYADAELVRL
ncbi:MAG TPA: hypothetical protein VD962_12320 [Rubricoccaceae bacterium]|nr:hypothetical protein [Rubricoccaceae bacterium]